MVRFVKSKPPESIVFIVDDWNYIVPEEKLLPEANSYKFHYRNMILQLVQDQYCITAMSAGCESITGSNNQDTLISSSKVLSLYGGLTLEEWETWKMTSKFYQQISEKDELKIIECTGLVPHYLKTMEENCKVSSNGVPLSESIDTLLRELYQDIYDNIVASSLVFMSRNKELFVSQMTYAIIDNYSNVASKRLYDHRYFYRDPAYKLRAVCGCARYAMRAFLELNCQDDFYERLTPSWMTSALNTGNPVVKGFAFELYALKRIVLHPFNFIDVPPSTCKVIRFSEYIPFRSQLNDQGLNIFIPLKFHRGYVDAVLRYVHPLADNTKKRKKTVAKNVDIYAVRITLQSFKNHKESLDFFNKGGDIAGYELEGEQVERCMLWVSREQPDVDATLPIAGAHNRNRVQYRQDSIMMTLN